MTRRRTTYSRCRRARERCSILIRYETPEVVLGLWQNAPREEAAKQDDLWKALQEPPFDTCEVRASREDVVDHQNASRNGRRDVLVNIEVRKIVSRLWTLPFLALVSRWHTLALQHQLPNVTR